MATNIDRQTAHTSSDLSNSYWLDLDEYRKKSQLPVSGCGAVPAMCVCDLKHMSEDERRKAAGSVSGERISN